MNSSLKKKKKKKKKIGISLMKINILYGQKKYINLVK
jgi:hypothetical protein